MDAADWIKLAERFEARGVWLLERQHPRMIVDYGGTGLFISTQDVAHIADCFTVAKGLRAKAVSLSRGEVA